MVLAIFGATGVGKTGVAVELAKLLRERGEEPVAVNCDALQVYEGLDVLTGAASVAEREVLPHELLGIVPVTSDFSIHEYMPLAHAAIDAALAAGRTPIVVGGTGLYLRAALADLSLRKVPAFDGGAELGAVVGGDPPSAPDLRTQQGPGEALRADRRAGRRDRRRGRGGGGPPRRR